MKVDQGRNKLQPVIDNDQLLSGLLEETPVQEDRSEMRESRKLASEELMFECDQLRKEILQNELLTLQIVTVMLLLTSTLMGFAFTQLIDNQLRSVLFFLVAFIAISGIVQSTERTKETFRIGSYIRTFIEPKTENLKWETRLSVFRTKRSIMRSDSIRRAANQRLIYLIIFVTNLFLGSYYFVKEYNDTISSDIIFILLTTWGGLLACLFLYLWRQFTHLTKTHTEYFDRIWKQVKDEEELPK